MKSEYEIKDTVWIHIGEPTLTEGRVVEIIDLSHLKEGHNEDDELYIIEIKTPIADIYEVRRFEEISPDAQGPIFLYRKKESLVVNRQFKKIGIALPSNALSYTPPLEEQPNKKRKHYYYRKKKNKNL